MEACILNRSESKAKQIEENENCAPPYDSLFLFLLFHWTKRQATSKYTFASVVHMIEYCVKEQMNLNSDTHDVCIWTLANEVAHKISLQLQTLFGFSSLIVFFPSSENCITLLWILFRQFLRMRMIHKIITMYMNFQWIEYIPVDSH